MHPTTVRSAETARRWVFYGKQKVIIGEELFLARRRFLCPWAGVLITRIYRPDDNRAPHTHSRRGASWIVSGGYSEWVYDDPDDLTHRVLRRHSRWSWHAIPRSRAHQITEITDPLWTLVFTGRHHRSFDFWTPAGKVDKDVYR